MRFLLLFIFFTFYSRPTISALQEIVQQVQTITEKNLKESIGYYTTVVKEALNFMNFFVVSAEQFRYRHVLVLKLIDLLKKKFQAANLMEYTSEITIHLEEMDDIYSQMVQILTGICYSNVEFYESALQLSKLNESNGNFSETVKEVVNTKVSYLQNLSDDAENESYEAYQYINKTIKQASDKLSVLIYGHSNSAMQGTCKLEAIKPDLGKKINEMEPEKFKALKSAIFEIETFCKNLKNHQDWLQHEKKQLNDRFNYFQKLVTGLKSQRAPLDQTVELFLKSNPEKFVSVSDLLDTRLETINELSLNYLIPYEENQNCEVSEVQHSEDVYAKINQKFESLFSLMSNKTKKKVLGLSLFFEVGVKNLEKIISDVKTKSDKFVDDMEAIHALLTGGQLYLGNSPDLLAQIARMSSGWEDIVSILKRLKNEWNSYLEAVFNNYDKSVSVVEENKIMDSSLNSKAEEKVEEILSTVSKFRQGTMDQVPYLDGKTTDFSHFAWNLVGFSKEILQDDNLSKISTLHLNAEKIEKGLRELLEDKEVPKEYPACSHSQYVPKSPKVMDKSTDIQKMLSKFGDTYMNGPTKKKSFALFLFFEIGLDYLSKFTAIFKTSINHYLDEVKSVRKYLENKSPTQQGNPDFINIKAQLMQLTLVWENIMYKLVLQRNQWYDFISSIDTTVKSAIEEQVDSTVDEVNYLLDEFQNGTEKSISSHFGEKRVNVSSIAYDIVAYAGKIL